MKKYCEYTGKLLKTAYDYDTQMRVLTDPNLYPLEELDRVLGLLKQVKDSYLADNVPDTRNYNEMLTKLEQGIALVEQSHELYTWLGSYGG